MSKTDYLSLINLAKQTLRQGDRERAKKLAEFIVENYPGEIEGLLLLGGLSKPANGLYYLEKAKAINPEDARVKAALSWANQQIPERFIPLEDQTTQKFSFLDPKPKLISPLPVTEKRGLVWIWVIIFIFFISAAFIGMESFPVRINRVSSHYSLLQSESLLKRTLTSTPNPNNLSGENNTPNPVANLSTPTSTASPSPSPTPTIVPNLYGCDMVIQFVSGPLEGQETSFMMLDRSYFYEKGDKFDTGKNTGLFYEEQRYLILHSGYLGGNQDYPLEIEFLRNYLELWGNESPEYIEEQIQNIKGSEMVWLCDGQIVLNLILTDVVRLSHEASNTLWLSPQEIFQIIRDREGPEAEWIGDVQTTNMRSVNLGFCGWGPPEIRVGRSIYYRYIINFDILD